MQDIIILSSEVESVEMSQESVVRNVKRDSLDFENNPSNEKNVCQREKGLSEMRLVNSYLGINLELSHGFNSVMITSVRAEA